MMIKKARELLDDIRNQDLGPNVITYNTLIDAQFNVRARGFPRHFDLLTAGLLVCADKETRKWP